MEKVESLVGTHVDFPKKGIVFKDIMPVFRNPEAYNLLMDELVSVIKTNTPNCCGLLGIEARGFMLACPLATRMQLPFIPIRKPGKLPGLTKCESFDKEYGHDTLEVQVSSIVVGGSYVILDDLLATGGTLKAACDLVLHCGGKVALSVVAMELVGLPGRKVVEDGGHKVYSLMKFRC